MDSFYSQSELMQLGFARIGVDVKISKKCSLYQAEKMHFGDNIRIDDFSLLSGKIQIGNNTHIAAGCYIFSGDEGVSIGTNVNISSGCKIYGKTDDFNGHFLVGPMVDSKKRNVISRKLMIGSKSVIGCNSVLLPGAVVREGVALGACSLLKSDTKEWSIYIGSPVKYHAPRTRLMS